MYTLYFRPTEYTWPHTWNCKTLVEIANKVDQLTGKKNDKFLRKNFSVIENSNSKDRFSEVQYLLGIDNSLS